MNRKRNRWERWVRLAGQARAGIAAARNGEEEGPLERRFLTIVFVIMLAPLPLWPFIDHGGWDRDFWYTIRHATLPIFLALLVGTPLFMPHFWRRSSWTVRGVTIGLATAMLLLPAQLHVSAINRWYGESEPVVVSGVVLDKLDSGEGAYGVRLRTRDGVVKLRVPYREYARIAVGGTFSRRYRRGSLGLLYLDR